MAALTVVRGGMLTTIQDEGRWGHQHLGVPVAGPMDWYSHRFANRLVGNEDAAAALEVTLLGPDLTTDADVACAVAGAAFQVTVDGEPAPNNTAFVLRRGQRLRFRTRTDGARRDAGGGRWNRCSDGARQPGDKPHQSHGTVRRPGTDARRHSAGRFDAGGPGGDTRPAAAAAVRRRETARDRRAASITIYARSARDSPSDTLHGDARVESHGLSPPRLRPCTGR